MRTIVDRANNVCRITVGASALGFFYGVATEKCSGGFMPLCGFDTILDTAAAGFIGFSLAASLEVFGLIAQNLFPQPKPASLSA